MTEEKIVDERRMINGVVDSVQQEPSGGFSVVEIKTNRLPVLNFSMKFELNFYKWLLEYKGINASEGVVYFPASNQELRLRLNMDVESIVEDVRRKINAEEFEHKPNCSCENI